MTHFPRGLGLFLRLLWRHAWPRSAGASLLLGSVLLAALAIRLLYIQAPVQADEAANALYYADRSILHALGGAGANENHVLNSLGMWASTRLFGWGEWQIRLPALAAGLFLVWAAYALAARASGDPATGLLAALLITFSPIQVAYSANGRGYSAQAACVILLTVLLLARAPVHRQSLNVWRGVAAGVLTACGALAVRSMLMYAVGLALAWGMQTAWRLRMALPRSDAGGHWRTVRGVLVFPATWVAVSVLLVPLLYAVPIVVHGRFGLLGVAGCADTPLPDALRDTLHAFLAVLPRALGLDTVWALVLAGTVILAGLWQVRARTRLPVACVAATVVAGFLLTPLAGVGLYVRTLVPLAALVLIVLALSLAGLMRRLLPTGAVTIGMLGVILFWAVVWARRPAEFDHEETGNIPEARAVAMHLLAQPDLRESIVVLPGYGWDQCIGFVLRKHGIPPVCYSRLHVPTVDASPGAYRQVLVVRCRGALLPSWVNGLSAWDILDRRRSALWYPLLQRTQAHSKPFSQDSADGEILRVPLGSAAEPM